MRFNPFHCPTCGIEARGTVERLAGCALFTAPDETGAIEWYGETIIWWDCQETVTESAGELELVRLICEDGHEWWATDDELPT